MPLKTMNPSNIKMISFDLFGVIVTEGHLISNVLRHLLPSSFEKAQVKSLYDEYNLGGLNEIQFWQALGIADYHQLRLTFLNSFQLDADFISVVNRLKSVYRLAILSNLPADWADELTRKFQFEKSFNPCLFSGHAQCKKPQAEIYSKLIAQSNLHFSQIAFIDDRLENLQTADELGMTTIYYQREHEIHDFRAAYRIKKLDEILQVFK